MTTDSHRLLYLTMKVYETNLLIAVGLISLLSESSGQNTGLPEPIALYPLNEQYGAKDISPQNNPAGKVRGVKYASGNYGQPAGSLYFSGSSSSYVEFPNNGGLDARNSMTFVAWIRPEKSAGPLFNYKVNDRGVYVWLESPNKLVVKFENLASNLPYAIESDKIRLKRWNYVAASYDNLDGTAKLWIDGRQVSRLNLGRFEIATQGDVRMGALVGDPQFYKGAIACVQIYNKSLSEQEINAVKDRCPIKVQSHHIGCYADKSSAPAVSSLEGKDVLLDGDLKTREDAEQKCARVALKRGYVYFAIQDGGRCLSSLTAQDTYSKYGLSTDCQGGKGGNLASDVYEVIMFSDQTCWNGWDAIQDSCFRLYDEKKTWNEAQSLCRAKKATLATLNSEDKNYFVFLQLVKPASPSSNPVWIGLSRDTENNFHWTDGTLVEYTNWGPGLPDNSPGNNQNCTKMNAYSGLWENEEFDFTHPFVCGRVIPSTPRDLRVKLMDSHSALVTWTSSEPPQQQLVTSYYLEYKVTNDEQVSLKVVVNHNNTSLTGLQTHAGYQVRIRAVNGAGGGIWSDYQTFSTGKTYPPRIDPLPPVRAQVPGETLVLNCTARGGPEPTITWYKDRKFLHRGQTLVIRNMTSERHELFSCRASNGIEPDDIVSVTVTSLVPPVLKQMWGTGTDGEMAIKKGERLSLNCEKENTTFAEITWYKDDELLPVQRTSPRNMIDIPEITGDDFGVYECKAQNALGVTSMKMRVINADLFTSMKVAVGCLAALCFLLLVVIGVLVWLLIKAKKTKASEDDEEPDEKSPVKPAGPRPSDSDFMIPEARAAGSPGMAASRGSNSSYSPLKSKSLNGGTSQTYKAT